MGGVAWGWEELSVCMFVVADCARTPALAVRSDRAFAAWPDAHSASASASASAASRLPRPPSTRPSTRTRSHSSAHTHLTHPPTPLPASAVAMDREFEGRDEEPVQLNASTSNVVVVDNVRRSNNTALRSKRSTVTCGGRCSDGRGRVLRSGRTV